MRSNSRPARLGALGAVVATILLGAVPASAAGTTGHVTWHDRADLDAVVCAYPPGDPTELSRIRVRGPRVSFPSSIGEVGWVRWTTRVQRAPSGSDTWRTVSVRRGRMSVDAQHPRHFRARTFRVSEGAAGARVRVVSRIRWVDQGGTPAGSVTHVMRHYDLAVVPGGAPIAGVEPVQASVGSCGQVWDR